MSRTQRGAQPPLPTRDGVSPSSVVLPAGNWPDMLSFMTERFPAVTQEAWQRRMRAGEIVDAHGMAVMPDEAYRPQRRLYYYRELETEQAIPFEEYIVFQDDYLVVADKPHFLPVTPSGRYVQETLLVRLKRRLGIDTLSPIHRIDRETAGLVVFAVQPETRGRYQELFREKSIRKQYEAIAPWRADLAWPMTYRSRIEEDAVRFMQMLTVEGEPNAETVLDVLDVQGLWARYALSPITGRKHQLRAQCAALGMPILNDLIYPELFPEGSDDYARPLQLLAKSIDFDDPISGQARSFQSSRTLRFPHE
ncbi:pseudouridine synthase [Uliginosibacterium sp. H3]|uniref:Pseudouridine synthase n=1 Tax=Uliginosibacterium silvisoli TaxID=3114758 RepID=A0ABU6K8V4_9RHOO|nr:pseudouridine synthase [Uliginosibacterium sp. H3]